MRCNETAFLGIAPGGARGGGESAGKCLCPDRCRPHGGKPVEESPASCRENTGEPGREPCEVPLLLQGEGLPSGATPLCGQAHGDTRRRRVEPVGAARCAFAVLLPLQTI